MIEQLRVKTWCPDCGKTFVLVNYNGENWQDTCEECHITWQVWLGNDGIIDEIRRLK